jgi:hypothetical protein
LRGAVHEKEIYKWWSYPFLQEDEGHVEMVAQMQKNCMVHEVC